VDEIGISFFNRKERNPPAGGRKGEQASNLKTLFELNTSFAVGKNNSTTNIFCFVRCLTFDHLIFDNHYAKKHASLS